MLLLLSSALAAPSSPAGLVTALEAHLDHAEGDVLPASHSCLTPLVAELRERADELSPDERKRVTRAITPWKDDFLAPIPTSRMAPPPAGSVPTEPCFSIGENRITNEHFAVEWDGDTISETTAQHFLDALEDGYDVEVDELGWEPPLQSDDYLLLAYVADGNSMSAYTTVEYCGSGFVPYMVAYDGSFQSLSWARTMAVHEFNHALQFGYGFAWEFWWWEATATYIESQVYPTANWWADSVRGYADNPQLAFNASDQQDADIFWHMYGMAIWAAYLDEYVGGPELVLATWDAADGERGTYSFGMEEALEELDLDFDTVYTDFITKNVVMQYEDQRVLPNVDERDEIDALPASDEADGRNSPEGYGQTYTRFEAGANDDVAGDLVVTFSGDDVPWSVQLVEVSDDEVLRVAVGDIVDGEGTVTLEAFGEEDAVLVISPLVSGDDRSDYEWEAAMVEPPAPVASEAEVPTACACTTGASPAGVGIGGLLGIAALVRRRRA